MGNICGQNELDSRGFVGPSASVNWWKFNKFVKVLEKDDFYKLYSQHFVEGATTRLAEFKQELGINDPSEECKYIEIQADSEYKNYEYV